MFGWSKKEKEAKKKLDEQIREIKQSHLRTFVQEWNKQAAFTTTAPQQSNEPKTDYKLQDITCPNCKKTHNTAIYKDDLPDSNRHPALIMEIQRLREAMYEALKLLNLHKTISEPKNLIEQYYVDAIALISNALDAKNKKGE